MRDRSRTFLPILLLLFAALLLISCGGGGASSTDSSGQVRSNDIPTATLPSVLPNPLIVSGTPRPASGERYVVQSGDNPSAIAERYGITTEQLLTANSISDPTSLVAGQTLVIPEVTPGANDGVTATDTPPPTVEESTPAPQSTATPSQQTYTVQQGDIPETIAARFGITADQLMAANGITDPASLQVGQVLIIPAPQ